MHQLELIVRSTSNLDGNLDDKILDPLISPHRPSIWFVRDSPENIAFFGKDHTLPIHPLKVLLFFLFQRSHDGLADLRAFVLCILAATLHDVSCVQFQFVELWMINCRTGSEHVSKQKKVRRSQQIMEREIKTEMKLPEFLDHILHVIQLCDFADGLRLFIRFDGHSRLRHLDSHRMIE